MSVIRARSAAALLVLLAGIGISPAATARCEALLPVSAAKPSPVRAITAEDLVGLRDIGFPDAALLGSLSPLALSPDGGQAAFVLNRADPITNSYCRALVVIAITPGAVPRIVDRGGELITYIDIKRGLFVPGGFPNLVIPAWSPDGRWIAYLKRIGGVTQVWRARSDGSAAGLVTRSPGDIEAVTWSNDGRALLIATRPGKIAAQAAIAREARSGYLYDERIVTYSGGYPQIRAADAPLENFAVDPASGAMRPATADETVAMGAAGGVGTLTMEAMAANGRRAWTERRAASPASPARLTVSGLNGAPIQCDDASCSGGIIGLWWDGAGRELRYLRREGWARGQTAFYRWSPGQGVPHRLWLTDDVIQGCRPVRDLLLCLRENSRTPRHIVLIDPVTGASSLVYDPNPEFAAVRLGRVERLKWTNDRGLEAWGDLVLPPGHRPGETLPMVVVQYHSDGFLRGGTGDDYPIYLFAAHGFAVLSLEQPAAITSTMTGLKDWDEIVATQYRGWAERRSLLSSLLTGVNLAVATGAVDRKRIGLTGLSDGSSTVRFALINAPGMFAAAAISTCCLDPKTVMTYGGIAWAEYNRKMGFPPATRDDPGFWQPYSLALNARDIDMPLLMQLPDDEYLMALEAFEALREHGKPVEMYVFPGEYHAKYQPIHRLAVYNRDVDWFSFWLQSRSDPDPAKAAQYARWEAMRATLRR
ncbi:Atxe2 family lasso peptide isopeptidase [Sphingomonas sp. So64.6b]|uniref:Atxe2 family lasso peptide isopeptidase n=1 Tax=Sphingomonas sp. So64.6b TaxID=2997354 RepID=UPI00160334C4|nr:Atxe2 family lasso peptide isopeptidase [Sphingomonas sp. So64.6b]QNA83746.1 Atxe2 family lasso peptide isopeptidase [Sphingomonas sp. So64.6b]